jgi:hypothetical protein
MIEELEKIKEFYIEKGDWISANQVELSIDVVKDYYSQNPK